MSAEKLQSRQLKELGCCLKGDQIQSLTFGFGDGNKIPDGGVYENFPTEF
jgi:hypothetical protein